MGDFGFTRVKYRDIPLSPSGRNSVQVTPQTTISTYKKTKVVEENGLDLEGYELWERAPLWAPHTQNTASQSSVKSKEIEHRNLNSPSFYIKMREHEGHMKRKEKDKHLKSVLEANKARWEDLMADPKLRRDPAAFEKAAAKLSQDEFGEIQAGGVFDEQEKDRKYLSADMCEMNEEFKAQARNMHEKKVLAIRMAWIAHIAMSDNAARYLSFKVWSGSLHWRWPSLFKAPNPNDGIISQILPWLFIGQYESAKDLDLLLKHKITHVLNVSKEIPNFHQAHFVYMQCELKDDSDQNAAKWFLPTQEFISRVEENKGKVSLILCFESCFVLCITSHFRCCFLFVIHSQIFIHCASGVSRAPTMAMSYLLQAKRIALGDAFDYLVACRPPVYPNEGFLFQLAKLEVHLGFGTSVRRHKEFSSYEYNCEIKADYAQYRGRSNKGVYRTSLLLNSKRKVLGK